MSHKLNYASCPASEERPSHPVPSGLRVGLWGVYCLCWAAMGLVGGAMLGMATSRDITENLLPGLIGGVLAGCALGWLAHGVRWLHVFCLAVGLFDFVLCAFGLVLLRLSGPHPFRWQIDFAVLIAVAGAFLAMTLAGGLGLLLGRPPKRPEASRGINPALADATMRLRRV